MTRSKHGLVVLARIKGVTGMVKAQTYFEQVPLEVVRAIVRKQIQADEELNGTSFASEKRSKTLVREDG
jgi:hypothetical protein